MTSYNIDGFQVYEYSSKKPKSVIFFAHANAIPVKTYAEVWTKMANALNVRIICYDVRGFGDTTVQPVYDENSWGWKTLVQDHVKLFKCIQKTHPKNTSFILSGHSSGAWISLLATEYIGTYPLLLCDPPILNKKTAFKWYLLNLFNRIEKNPRSQKVLKRKTAFDSYAAAFESFKQTPFLSKWSDSALDGYIHGLFKENSETHQFALRYDPKWEAHIFTQYPPTAAHGFLELSAKLRRELRPVFLVGEKSDSCNPKAKNWVKLFFPNTEWVILPQSGHMFPIENADLFVETLSRLGSTKASNLRQRFALEV